MSDSTPGGHPSTRTASVILLIKEMEQSRHRDGRARALAALALLPIAVLVCLLGVGAIVAASKLVRGATPAVLSPGSTIEEMANYGGAQIYDRNNQLLYRFPDSDGGVRTPLQLHQVSRWMVDSTVSTEDAGFWSSNGIDPLGTLRSATTNVVENGTPFEGSGGSGITQQLVKQTLIRRISATSSQ